MAASAAGTHKDTGDTKGWCWLYSKEYIKEYQEPKKLEMSGNRGVDIAVYLNNIVLIECRPNDSIGGEMHRFSLEDKVFGEVMETARRTERDERNR